MTPQAPPGFWRDIGKGLGVSLHGVAIVAYALAVLNEPWPNVMIKLRHVNGAFR